MESSLTVKARVYCYNCKQSFKQRINPNDTSEVVCVRCKSEFIEISDESNPPSARARQEISITAQVHPTTQPAPTTQGHILIERQPGGFRYVSSIGEERIEYRVQTTNTEEVKEEAGGRRERELPDLMNEMIGGATVMEIRPSLGTSFRNELEFSGEFPELSLRDLFSDAHTLHPISLGIDLQDFGMNFSSNFRSGQIIDLIELLRSGGQGTDSAPPASKEAISKLPVFKIEEKHCKKDEKGKLEQPNCAICCTDINLGERAQLIPCGHMFHPDCTKPWFLEHNTCPICRYELPTDDPHYEASRRTNQQGRRHT